MNGISTFIKETLQSSLASLLVRTQQENQKAVPHQTLNLLALEALGVWLGSAVTWLFHSFHLLFLLPPCSWGGVTLSAELPPS